MSFKVRVGRRGATFTQTPEGRWKHDTSQTATVFGTDGDRRAWERAEDIRWALDSGLVDPGSATLLSKTLGLAENRLRHADIASAFELCRAPHSSLLGDDGWFEVMLSPEDFDISANVAERMLAWLSGGDSVCRSWPALKERVERMEDGAA